MRNHIKIVGILHIVLSLLFLAGGVFMILFISGAINFSGIEEPISEVAIGIVYFASILLIVLALPGLIAGAGVLSYKNWARNLLIIISVINLLNFPVGTVLGVYTIWVMTHAGTKALTKHHSYA